MAHARSTLAALTLLGGCGAVLATPELVCDVRAAEGEQTLRVPLSADPYAITSLAVNRRFRLQAMLLGAGPVAEQVVVSVLDLTHASGPSLAHQGRWLAPFAAGSAVPALTGWQKVYASGLGHELRYGCALQERQP